MIAALLKEIEIFDWTTISGGEEPIETIYFGGGTPSLLESGDLNLILEKIKSRFEVDNGSEITLEANPDDINSESLHSWRNIGINRLSIGVQSFFDEDLRWMNRAHNATQSQEALRLATQMFDNITMDLIYGSPGLTHEKWKANVDMAIGLNVPHLSCYALTVEPKTPLQKMITLQTSPDVDPGIQSEQFLMLMDWLEGAGYEHYEISNFAKSGFRSRHNSSYWQGKTYIGFGPSAHSFDGEHRWWNVANNQRYISSLENSIIPLEKETLSVSERVNEYIMISLRTSGGTSLEKLQKLMADEAGNEKAVNAAKILKGIERKVANYIDSNLMVSENGYFRLTRRGKFLADGIAADLFI